VADAVRISLHNMNMMGCVDNKEDAIILVHVVRKHQHDTKEAMLQAARRLNKELQTE